MIFLVDDVFSKFFEITFQVCLSVFVILLVTWSQALWNSRESYALKGLKTWKPEGVGRAKDIYSLAVGFAQSVLLERIGIGGNIFL